MCDEVNDHEMDVSELDELVRNMLSIHASETSDNAGACSKAGDWRDVERYLDEKRLREAIYDPLFIDDWD